MMSNILNATSKALTNYSGASSITEGLRTVHDNAGPTGSTSGVVHGAMKVAQGAATLSGVGTLTAASMMVADLGMQAYRDAHDLSSPEITHVLNQRQGVFTADQWSTVQEARRLFTFAKATNHVHPSINPNVSDDAMRGGHVVVEDGGALDARFRLREQNGTYGGDRSGPNKPRYNLPSSHYPGMGTVQSEHQMPSDRVMNFGTALHGTTQVGPGADSWFQMEAHSGVWSSSGGIGRAYTDYALHATDFVRHKATTQQVGPLGTSPVMENNPLRVSSNDIMRSRIATAAANHVRAQNGQALLTPLG
jgi:hypothetical protein